MDKIQIELPQVVEVTSSVSGLKRTAMFEYTLNGKLISKEEADAVVCKWQDYIKKLVPQTKFKAGYVRYDGSMKDHAVSAKNSLKAYSELSGKPIRQDLLERAEQKIAEASDTDGTYEIMLLDGECTIADEEGKDLIIAGICLRFYPSEEARVEIFNTKDASHDGGKFEYYESWQKGVEMYAESVKIWLATFGPQMEIPLPR
jgi:hypothetical protein